MEERDSEKQLQIRALTGESITVSISTNKTIADLKLLLTRIFPLAAKYSNFNLFHKGVRLSMQCPISDYLIDPGEVIGFVPVIKKKIVQIPNYYDSDNSGDLPSQSPISKFADLAWSDMMQDIRDMSSTSKGLDMGLGSTLVSDGGNNVNEKDSATSLKRKRTIIDENAGSMDDDIMRILQPSGASFFNDQNLKKVEKVMELQNCLQDPSSYSCVLLNIESSKAGGRDMCKRSAGLCVCPQWLKTIMKSFTFLNIYAAYLQLQQEKFTSNHLEKALNWLGRFSIQVSIKDIENLSLLCPKELCFVDHNLKGKRIGHALVIINSCKEENNQLEAGARTAANEVSLPKHFYLLKRRERSFMVALASLVHNIGNKVTDVSTMEDLLKCVKEGDNSANMIKEDASAAGGNELKQERRVKAASVSNAGKRLCLDINALLPTEMVKHLQEGIGSNGQIVHVEEIGCRKPAYKPIPDEFSQDVKHMLERIGVTKLYSHQADSIQASLAHKHVVVATMTSSGKSLCYNLPVLEELLKDPSSCALYMFPTKALSQDQLRALNCMTEGFSTCLCIGIYDGDTPWNERTFLRENARVLITNPDMLHKSILPYHGKFVRILSKLRFVVIDEAHSYKGAFGCHTALILRRLRRLCSHVYGSDPTFIFCTATSANPREHCMELANISNMELIQNDGSPSAKKLFVLWNPSSSLITAVDQKQRGLEVCKSSNKGSSPIWEVSCLFAEMVQHGLRCITFCGSRKLCELVLCYAREILQEMAPNLIGSISSYRSGYAPEVRRQIESDFFSGKLLGLAATNALELGIDVGHLDATLHLGFPGSIASLQQQAGRSGRREKPSIAVYVAFNSPLDQYFMKCPQKLFRSPVECWNIDAQNQQVLEQHLVCAASEHPLSAHYDEKFFGSSLSNIIITLRNKGYLSSDPSHESSARIWSYIGREKKPSDIVNIRAIETETYQVIDIKTNEVLEKIEESKAFFQVHDGAVYMRQGKTYLVKNLDLSCKIAWCQEADLKYYTKTRDYTDVKVVGGDIAYPVSASHISQTNAEANRILGTTAQANPCKVITTWFGFRRFSRGSNQVLDTVELSLPKYSYESQAVWIQVPQAVKEAVEMRNFPFRAGLHAASHALLNVVPLCIICNSSDLAPECSNPHDSRSFAARVLLYDKHPGGTGVALQVRPHFSELLNAALEILTSCCCLGDAGCPKCIQTPACHEYNEDLHKDAAGIIIKGVLDSGKLHYASF